MSHAGWEEVSIKYVDKKAQPVNEQNFKGDET